MAACIATGDTSRHVAVPYKWKNDRSIIHEHGFANNQDAAPRLTAISVDGGVNAYREESTRKTVYIGSPFSEGREKEFAALKTLVTRVLTLDDLAGHTRRAKNQQALCELSYKSLKTLESAAHDWCLRAKSNVGFAHYAHSLVLRVLGKRRGSELSSSLYLWIIGPIHTRLCWKSCRPLHCGENQTGETALLRQMFGQFQRGDVALADALFANFWTLAALLKRGVDTIVRRDGKRPLDWRVGKRLGKKDHLVVWHKPAKPVWMSRKEYHRMPAELCLRELAVDVAQPGFRTRRVVIVTTLLEIQLYPRQEVAAAYRARWHAELDLRAIKQVMAMEVLRCKTPAMVHKEIWMHLLAYNLVRTLLADAAQRIDLPPRELSFKGALQTLNAFAAVWPLAAVPRETLYAHILHALACHRVGDRPDRVEPRAVKRRPRKQTFLTQPRHIARNRLLTKV